MAVKKTEPGGDDDLKRVAARVDAAYARLSEWDSLLKDVYDHFMPYRRKVEGEDKANRRKQLFDSTGLVSNHRFAGRMQSELTPPHQAWFELDAGSIKKEDRDKLLPELEETGHILQLLLDTPAFHNSSLESYQDLGAGTGVLLALESYRREEIIRYVAAPAFEFAFEVDGDGEYLAGYWKKMHSRAQILAEWADKAALINDVLPEGQRSQSDPADIEVVHSWQLDRSRDKNKQWRYLALLKSTKKGQPHAKLAESFSRERPFIPFRFFRYPGEDRGRGPCMIALPNARVANKSLELILSAAAISLFGVFTVTDDGLINPDKAVLEPGALWQVRSNATGAYGGRSLEQLNLPQNFDISDIVLNDQRQQIRAAMMDVQLPQDGGAVRSPTEIIARQRLQSFDIGAAFGRLVGELIVPLVKRVYEIAENKDLVKPGLDIDGIRVKVRPVGPLANAQNLAQVESRVTALQISQGVGGEELTMMTYKVEDILKRIGRLSGIPENELRDDVEKKQLTEMIGQMMVQAQQAQEGGGADGGEGGAMPGAAA